MRRRSSLRYGLLSLLLIVAAFGMVAMTASAAPPTVAFASPINLSNSSSKSVYSAIASDAAGHLHVMWLEYAASDADPSQVYYTNNVNGSFGAARRVIGNAGRSADPMTAIAVSNNQVHLFYDSTDVSARETILNLSGADFSVGPTTTLSPKGAKAFVSSATVDTAGRVHAAWIDRSNGQYQAYHRVYENGNWSGIRAIHHTGDLQVQPKLAATADGRVHAVVQNGDALLYSYFDGNNWIAGPNAPGNGKINYDALASDGTTLYAAWSESEATHVIRMARLVGGAWQNNGIISDAAVFSDFPDIFYSPGNNKVYSAWSTGTDKYSVAIREITPGGGLSDIVIIGTPPSIVVRGAAGASGIGVVWQDKKTGAEETKLAFATLAAVPTPVPPTPTPPPIPVGTMTIPAEYTSYNGIQGVDGTFNVLIRNTGAAATQLHIQSGSVGADYNFTPDANGAMFVPFNFPAGSLPPLDSRCVPQTLTATLTGSSGVSAPFSAMILVDADVDATVQVRNPNSSTGNSAGTTLAPSAGIPDAFGPRDAGNPSYTRSNFYYLAVSGIAGECAGAKQYGITYTGTPDTSVVTNTTTMYNLLRNGEPGVVSMPSTIEGPYSFFITVKDIAGNVRYWPDQSHSYKLILDYDKPTVSLPNSQTTVQVVGGDNGQAKLLLDNVQVRDNLYPNQSTQPDQQTLDYWGSWVAVKQVSQGDPTPAEWVDDGVVIQGLATNEQNYNLAMGMVGAFSPGAQYKVYIRYLDGAGNAADAIRSDSFAINALTGPRIFMPSLTRNP